MSDARLELPLRFKRHNAVLQARREAAGWKVTTCIDGRVVGIVNCCNWRHLELYRERVQEWLKVAEGIDRLWSA